MSYPTHDSSERSFNAAPEPLFVLLGSFGTTPVSFRVCSRRWRAPFGVRWLDTALDGVPGAPSKAASSRRTPKRLPRSDAGRSAADVRNSHRPHAASGLVAQEPAGFSDFRRVDYLTACALLVSPCLR